MATIDKFIPIVLKAEGGFVNDPDDKGGATNKGITLATYRSFFGVSKSVEDLKHISDAQVQTIYQYGYWNKVKGNQIHNQSVANLIADFAVNSGSVRAIRYVQSILGVTVDGILGSNTLNALNSADQCSFFTKLKEQRKAFYNSIVNNKPSQAKFLKGWMRRLDLYSFSV